MSADIHDNAAWAGATPTLSVLIPFLRDDPTDLLGQLDREAAALSGADHGRIPITENDRCARSSNSSSRSAACRTRRPPQTAPANTPTSGCTDSRPAPGAFARIWPIA